MERYKFDSAHSEKIVEAIVEGYRDYIKHRQDRHQKMKISSAFAWTKGNFIESKIAEASRELNYSYKMAKAGLTWDYLQFSEENKKKLFLLKNANYFNENSFSHAVLPHHNRKGKIRSYLHELSKINQNLEFPTDYTIDKTNEQNEQLTFEFYIPERRVRNDLKQFQSSYNEFHIITYKIDSVYQISEVRHFLPNPGNNIAYRVENLSKYISGAELTSEEREIIAPVSDFDVIDPAAFDIGIIEEEKTN
ncbi:hypothetical protein ACFFIS_15480 [Virgibacillus soli]|uniref:Uncharacterized protein n=1 Tax=Paracerasibacillus soli TaxID=480284 RepID=A0ABU5CUW4_9BACI|nr:hypothetical protein [Virgibacillus soli]MDY0410169.1 hypothetical protein [Virgibacillus soli]